MKKKQRTHGRSSVLVGRGWALHLGDGRLSRWHQHHALQINAGISAGVSLAESEGHEIAAAAGWVIAPDHPHRIVCEGPLVTLLIEPEGAHADALLTLLGDRPTAALTEDQRTWLAAEATECWSDGWRVARAEKFVARALEELAPAQKIPRRRDKRIGALLALLAQDAAEARTSSELASQVGLSTTRMTHLFREQVGLAIRPYRLWLRLQSAARLMAEGASATEAAMQAGFSDAAHFTRTCNRIFGFSPSALPQMQFEPTDRN